ncbi:hypothetical protein FKP32DRAFT_1671603 [Trametes sanguinea]|nr:hypothetical protein FKP32DRAFT_1671603 [Trametes sanguinea]
MHIARQHLVPNNGWNEQDEAVEQRRDTLSLVDDIWDILDSRLAVVARYEPYGSPSQKESVIDGPEMRALYAKALLWYIDRQCLNMGDRGCVMFNSPGESHILCDELLIVT